MEVKSAGHVADYIITNILKYVVLTDTYRGLLIRKVSNILVKYKRFKYAYERRWEELCVFVKLPFDAPAVNVTPTRPPCQPMSPPDQSG